MYHQNEPFEEWIEESVSPFDELILSWNGKRPEQGTFSFYVSLKGETWSPWLPYAFWGCEGQKSFGVELPEEQIGVYQDVIVKRGRTLATGFRVRVISTGEADLKRLHALHVYTNRRKEEDRELATKLGSIRLAVPKISQMTQNHPRKVDLCSPTSTAAVIRYLGGKVDDLPLFAERVRDQGFDLFGNWVLNVAEASAFLGPGWKCWVERLEGFFAIHQRLCKNTPVIISVRGPLPGSALPYANGHLLVATGYEAKSETVLCMDPAFPEELQKETSYPLSELVKAWERRGKIAYIFEKS